MPCFKGIAVSIHSNGQIPEHGGIKNSRVSRITSYIPVPEPARNPETGAQEPAKFAISITLLTPNLAIPYSTPEPTKDNPDPKPSIVGLPGPDGKVVTPYMPLTQSENETIAAYIYFDGRAKEEVATLLRPGEETWVNSRWVSDPSQKGGLAEREFLFREVALERWLNGLDLTGHDAKDKVQKRRLKYEKRKRLQEKSAFGDSPAMSDDDDISVSSDDEIPESTGQIKVAMFRVLASGEIKKGEYSPQFDAQDDDEDAGSGDKNGDVNADIEHTTSFAKPKTLDPKTISTQTVTGIDGPEKPYATFTFFYRGKRQLEKMGVIETPKNKTGATPSSATKRRSAQIELPKLGPLKTGGTVGFSAFRDQGEESTRRRKSRKKSLGGSPAAMDADSDSDDDDDDHVKMEDIDEKEPVTSRTGNMSPEEAKFSGELADGVERIHLKRARSADPDSAAAGPRGGETGGAAALFGGSLLQNDSTRGTPPTAGKQGTPPPESSTGMGAPGSLSAASPFAAFGAAALPDAGLIGSPLKKQRPSLQDEQLSRAAGLGSILAQQVQGSNTPAPAAAKPQPPPHVEEEEEEL